MRKMLLAVAAGMFAILSGATAHAQPTLDFINSAGHGSVSYAGGAAVLSGSGLVISGVEGVGTPTNDLVTVPIQSGILTFTSGLYTSVNSTATDWQFLGNSTPGSVKIVGGVSSLGIPTGTVLLTGTLMSAAITETTPGTGKVAISLFIDTVNATVASDFGLTGGSVLTWNGNFGINFASGPASNTPATGSAAGASGSGMKGGNVYTSPTPEPSSMALAGLGALGLIGYGLRRRKAMGA